MHKDQLYPILDSIKLAIDGAVSVLNANNSEWTGERQENIKSARATIEMAQRKMRDVLGFDFDTMEYKDEEND